MDCQENFLLHYSKGDRVIDDGFIYEAKWWTNSDPSNNNGGDGVPWLKIAPFVTTAPDAPTNLKAENIKSTGLRLSWDGNESNYVEKYTVTSDNGTQDYIDDDKKFADMRVKLGIKR